MKISDGVKGISILFIMLAAISTRTNANWIKSEHSIQNNPYIPTTQTTSHNKVDSLPSGVTNDWLNGLRDENGKIIVPEDPEGDALQQRAFTGAAVNDEYGYSVSSAGDVNGDGYDDVIIGAPDNDAGGTDAGRAYIYYGGVNMNSIADVILTGEAIDNYFGSSVSKAGDLNGDGYSDVIVGAPQYNNNMGKVYIYYGGAAMNNVADLTMTGADTNYLGISVSTAGDLNGDGYSDVIVGADGYINFTGRAYIFFGGAVMNNIADIIMTGAGINSVFGYSVSSAGDINRDGYSDVIVGSQGYNLYTGRAFIFLGGASMNNIADVTLTGEAVDNYFGLCVSDAGDVNNDGCSDVIVGALGYNAVTGRAYIYYGGVAMNNVVDVTMTGENSNDYFGYSVSAAGDINGDGYSDVIISAPAYNGNSGKGYIYYGSSSMNSVVDIVINRETVEQFGTSVSEAGDVNGDGYSDVIVGARYGAASYGSAYIFTNTVTGDDIADIIATGETANSNFGFSVSAAGDVNGDGYPDVIIGAYAYGPTTGRAYIYYGGPLMDNIADVTMTAGNYFGLSVSGAGDVNGDGYADVIVGSYLYNSNTGRAIIYYGGSSMDNSPDVVMIGEIVGSYFGYSVSDAGDVNNDGYADVIIGAYNYDPSFGRVYIYYGGAAMNNVADVIFQQGYLFGRSVSGAGDVNGDGYDDVISGSHAYNSNAGRALIYFGGVAMDNLPDVVLFGESTNNYFGFSVSRAGDIDNDGYSDVIVGAYGYNSSTGRAYIYRGGSAMNDVADVILTGESVSNFFGSCVSDAGDVNGDGFSDVITGAQSYNASTGRGYVYYGGVSMNNIVDVTMTGVNANNYFGNSVSGAGDLNGDGNADVIGGAVGNGSSNGKAYIYLSSPPVPHGILNLTMIIEGFFDNAVDNMRMSDTVKAYLRNSVSPYAIVDSSKDVINNNFFSGKFKIKNAATGNYYLVVKHRNSIETWSRLPVSYTKNGTTNYTFTTSSLQAFGNNMKQVDTSPTRFGIFSGDANQDGIVDAADLISVFNDVNNVVSGYVKTDMTGDNFVDVSDLILAFNNANDVVSIARP